MEKEHVLVVCLCNINRSPTVEKFLSEHFGDKMEVKSAGIYHGYPRDRQVNKQLVAWADRIIVMDLEQYIFIDEHFKEYPPVEVLGISDQYDPDDPALIRLLEWFYIKKPRLGVKDCPSVCKTERDGSIPSGEIGNSSSKGEREAEDPLI